MQLRFYISHEYKGITEEDARNGMHSITLHKRNIKLKKKKKKEGVGVGVGAVYFFAFLGGEGAQMKRKLELLEEYICI